MDGSANNTGVKNDVDVRSVSNTRSARRGRFMIWENNEFQRGWTHYTPSEHG